MSRSIMPSLIGNERIKQILSAQFSDNKPLHAYIFAGAQGSGKNTLAKLLCASFVCEHKDDDGFPLPCGTCASCRKVLNDHSVDVIRISNGDKASVGVDAIRQIKESLYITPNDGEKKFYIIDNAHLMTTQAQNALLLSLEEPPQHAVIILLCEDISLLLETIRSRAPTFTMESFDADFIEKYLTEKYEAAGVDRKKAVFAAHIANGSLGRAQSLYEHGDQEMKLYDSAAALVECLVAKRKSDAIVAVSSLIQNNRASTCRMLSLTRMALRDVISEKKNGDLIFYSKQDGVPAFAKKVSIKKIMELISAVKKAEEDISANCSQANVMTCLVLNG